MSELSGQERHKLGADFILPIMQITGNYRLMNYLARELGGAFILVNMDSEQKDNVLHMSLVSSCDRQGQVFISVQGTSSHIKSLTSMPSFLRKWFICTIYDSILDS